MGGVPDHHVRLWHLLHHSGLSHFPLGLLDLSLDFRISLCLLELLLDLLFGHPDLPLIVPPLIKDICRSQHREGRPDLHGQQEALLKQMGTGRQKIGVKIFGKQVQHVGDIPENQYQKNCDLQQSFQRLHNTAQGKQPFHSLQRADPAQLRPQGLP